MHLGSKWNSRPSSCNFRRMGLACFTRKLILISLLCGVQTNAPTHLFRTCSGSYMIIWREEKHQNKHMVIGVNRPCWSDSGLVDSLNRVRHAARKKKGKKVRVRSNIRWIGAHFGPNCVFVAPDGPPVFKIRLRGSSVVRLWVDVDRFFVAESRARRGK